MISLKCDIATRNCKSFLGINAHFIADLQLQLRTLATKVLEDKHTIEYLRTIMKDVLKEYGFSLQNVYSCTTDNGSNMVKLVKIIRLEQGHEIDGEDDSLSEDEENRAHTSESDE